MSALTLTRQQILNTVKPEHLFPGDIDEAQMIYRRLVGRWHPDKPDGDSLVAARINVLYKSVTEKILGGCYEGSATVRLVGSAGRVYLIDALANVPCDVGRVVLANESVSYLFDAAAAKRADGFAAASKLFAYPNPKVRDEVSRYLPHLAARDTLEDGRTLLAIKKTGDLIRLADVQRHMGGTMPPEHVAWIISSLMNLLCYFSVAGFVHHAISTRSYFISPKFHSGALLGDWWFAAPRGSTIKEVPAATHQVMPFDAKTKKRASTLTDAECVRALGRDLLGGIGPKPMHRWMGRVAAGTAHQQYEEWSRVLDESFGPRKFIKLSVDATAVYSTK